MKQLIICLSLTIFISSGAFSQIQVDSIGNVGVGTNAPSAKLDVEGSVQIKDGTQADKLILTSDADGNASWQALSTESIFGSLSISDSTCMSILNSLNICCPLDIAASGNYLYVLSDEGGFPPIGGPKDSLLVIDVSDPLNPVQINKKGTSRLDMNRVVVRGNLLTVIGTCDINYFDISNPAAPSISLVTGHPGGCGYTGLTIGESTAYYYNPSSFGIGTISLTSASSPGCCTGPYPGGTSMSTIISAGSIYYVQNNNLYRLISIPPLDTVNLNIPNIGSGADLKVFGSYLCLADNGSDSLRLIDISNVSNTFVAGSIYLGGDPGEIQLNGNLLYVVDQSNDILRIIDISDPTNPVIVQSIALSSSFSGALTFSGNLIYVNGADIDIINSSPCYNSSVVSVDPYTGGLVSKPLLWQKSNNDIFNLNTANVGIGTNSPAYTLHVNGTAAKPGGGSWTVASDGRLKKNIKDFVDGLELVNKIEPKTFSYNGKAGIKTSEEYVGVIAQDLQKIAPYMVSEFETEDGNVYLSFNPSALDFVLINAVKEQQEEIEKQQIGIEQQNKDNIEQQKEIEELKNTVGTLMLQIAKLTNK